MTTILIITGIVAFGYGLKTHIDSKMNAMDRYIYGDIDDKN